MLCCTGLDADNGIAWAQFLGDLRDAKLSLVDLQIIFRQVPLNIEEIHPAFHPSQQPLDEGDDVPAARQQLAQNSRLRLFAYSVMEAEFESACHDEYANLEDFRRGNDQRAFDAVMEVLVENVIERDTLS